MIYLLLSITCNVLVTIIFKINSNKKSNIYGIISLSYITSIVFSFFMIINDGTYTLINADSIAKFVQESLIVFSSASVFSMEASVIWGILIGLTFGPIFCLAFFRYQKSIIENGMSIANTFMKLSVVIPVLVSAIIWREYPSNLQFLGIILCIFSILILNLDIKSSKKISFNNNLLLLIVLGGIAQFTAKIYQKYGLVDCKSILTLFTFISAFLTSLIFYFKNRNPITKRELITGAMIGIPNLFATIFLVLALEMVETHIAYLLSSLLSIFIVLIIGMIFFNEKLQKKDLSAVTISVLAIFLINS